MDVTTFFGYRSQFVQSLENNGSNPVVVTSITLIQEADLRVAGLYHELENSVPLTISGNDDVDIFSAFYSLCISSQLFDLTYQILCNVIDMSDLTTVIDVTTLDMTFDLTSGAIEDPNYYGLLHKLNKYFHVGPNESTDTTLKSTSFTSTGYPLIEFENGTKFQLFTVKYAPQFVVFSNTSTLITVIAGAFNQNNTTNSLEAYFTADEKSAITGLTFNNIYMFYADSVLN